MAEPHLLTERRGHVLVVTMNRPEARNALSSEMLARMYDAWVELDTDPDLRVRRAHRRRRHVLLGHGPQGLRRPASRRRSGPSGSPRTTTSTGRRCSATSARRSRSSPRSRATPSPAAPRSSRRTEIRVAGESATFGITEVARGLFPLGGSTVRLRRQIPFTLAAEMLLTGRHVPPPRRRRSGSSATSCPTAPPLDKAIELAEVVAGNAPLSVQAVLRSLREGGEMSEADGLANELTHGWPIFATEDAKEGATAFKEKRKPDFKGK